MKIPINLKQRWCIPFFLLVLVAFLLATESWKCPYCKQAFPWPPNDPAGLRDFQRRHMAVCPSRPRSEDSGPSAAEMAAQQRLNESRILNDQGIKYWKNGQWKAAANAFKAALEKNPDNPSIRRNYDAARRAAAKEEDEREAAEARRKQEQFERAKQDALKSMKGIEGGELKLKETGEGELGLKEAGDTKVADNAAKRVNEAAPDITISNPQIARIMKGLQAIRVPPPFSQKEVALSWKPLALDKDFGENTADYLLMAWDMAGKFGDKGFMPQCKVLLIAGKTFIAGEEGALVHVIKQDQYYESALRYLKNPAAAKRFTGIVSDMKAGRPLPASADAGMVRAARAIIDPKLGGSGMRIAWDAMLSPEARGAMVRKVCMEVGAELVGSGAEGLTGELVKRKELYQAARLERDAAKRMLKQTSDALDKDQLRKVINHANHVLEDIYRLENLGPKAMGSMEAIYVSGEVEKLSEKSDKEK